MVNIFQYFLWVDVDQCSVLWGFTVPSTLKYAIARQCQKIPTALHLKNIHKTNIFYYKVTTITATIYTYYTHYIVVTQQHISSELTSLKTKNQQKFFLSKTKSFSFSLPALSSLYTHVNLVMSMWWCLVYQITHLTLLLTLLAAQLSESSSSSSKATNKSVQTSH